MMDLCPLHLAPPCDVWPHLHPRCLHPRCLRPRALSSRGAGTRVQYGGGAGSLQERQTVAAHTHLARVPKQYRARAWRALPLQLSGRLSPGAAAATVPRLTPETDHIATHSREHRNYSLVCFAAANQAVRAPALAQRRAAPPRTGDKQGHRDRPARRGGGGWWRLRPRPLMFRSGGTAPATLPRAGGARPPRRQPWRLLSPAAAPAPP
ncbi:MAG: hypothetical protein J3K34DRAFT_260095 [Monoraphidium minutum]|nr:MAG: hypothetical protein J3K34DRAFT_260095 [Monoraphidium minutum]